MGATQRIYYPDKNYDIPNIDLLTLLFGQKHELYFYRNTNVD